MSHPRPPHLLDLWRNLSGFIHAAFGVCGAPLDLARRMWLPRAEHRISCEFLRSVEDLLRRLVFIDALEALAQTPAPAPCARKPSRTRARPAAAFDAERPETWRASFNLGASRRRRCRCRPRAPRPIAPPLDIVSSAPLARRVEALRCGFNESAGLVRRLMRILRRNRRAARIYTRPPLAPPSPRSCAISLGEAISEAASAYAKRRRRNNTS